MTRILVFAFFLASQQLYAADKPQGHARAVFVITDENNQPLTVVSPGQIAAQLNGSSILDFSIVSLKDLPLQICLMFDTSASSAAGKASMNRFFKGAEALLRISIRPKTDSACLVDFSSHFSVDQDWTDGVDSIVENVKQHFDTRGGTALYDSLAATCQYFDASKVVAPRRVVLLGTDGQDNASKKSLDEAIRQCQSRGIMVFTFDVSAREEFGWCGTIDNPGCARPEGAPLLREIAEKSGGTYFSPSDEESTINAYKIVIARLDAIQQIEFDPPSAKAKLTLRATQPKWNVRPKQIPVFAAKQ
jgi:hypothetical protein